MPTPNKQKDGSYSSLTGFHRAVPIILFALAIFVALCFFTKNTGALGSAICDFLLGCFSIGGYFIPLFLALHAFFYASDIQLGKPIRRVIFSLAILVLISSLAHALTNFGAEPVFDAEKFYSDGMESVGGGFIGGLISYIIIKIIGHVGLLLLTITVFALYITYSLTGKRQTLKKLWDKLVYAFIKLGAKIEKKIKTKIQARKAKKEESKNRAAKAKAAKESELYNDDFFDVNNGMKELHIDELGINEKKSDEAIAENPYLQEKVHPKSRVSDDKSSRKAKKESRRNSFNPNYVVDSYEEGATTSSDNDIIFDIPNRPAYAFEDNPEFVFTEDFIPLDIEANEKLAAKHSSMTIKVTEEAEEIKEKPTRRLFSEDEVSAARRRAEFELRKSKLKEQSNASKATAPDFNAEPIISQPPSSPQSSPAQSEEPIIVLDIPGIEDTFEPQNPYSTPERNENLENKYKRSAGYASVINEFPKEEEAKRLEKAREAAAQLAREKELEEQQARERELQQKHEKEIELERIKAQERALEQERLAREKDFQDRLAKERELTEKRVREEAAAQYASIAAENAQKKDDPIARIFEEELAKSGAQTTPDISSNGIALEFSTEEDSETQVFNFEDDNISASEPTKNIFTAEPIIPTAEDAPIRTSAPDSSVSTAIPDTFDQPAFSYEENHTQPIEQKPRDFIFESDSDIPGDEEDSTLDEEIIPESEQNPQINEYRKMFSLFDDERSDDDFSSDNLAPTNDVTPSIPALTDYSDYGKTEYKNDMFSSVSSSENIIDEEYEAEYSEADESEEIEDEFEDDLPPFDFEPVQTRISAEPDKPKQEKPDYTNYEFPSLELLAKGVDEEDPTIEEEISETGDKLIDTLAQFNVRASIKSVDRGPRITRYEIVPARGVRVSSVMSTENDIKLNLAAEGLRMEAPIPGKSAIGVEVPNQHPSNVYLRDLLESDEFRNANSKTYCCVGKDVTGNPVFGDIAKMPHVLIAGATGMGKSVCINSILISILYKAKPDEVKFIMVDPKTVEFTMYNGIPHLLVPVVTDVKQAAGALMWAIDEMNRRYELMAKHEVRQLDSYNELVRKNPEMGETLPKIIIVIDELNDLMQQVRKPVEGLITNITQKARAAGIHMIIGTQRPSVDVITGVIKANVPSRISCKVTSFNDSKTILDKSGAEKLLGRGDMLFAPVGKSDPLRVQGAFVSDGEVEKVMKFLKSNVKGNIYDEQALEDMTRAAQKCAKGKDSDDDFDSDDSGDEGAGYLNDKQFLEAVDLAVRQGKISTSLIQRKISVGYGKAAKFIDIMEDMGLVSEPNGQKPRDVLVTRDEWHEMLSRRSLDD